jgi:glutathione S-transferase
MLPSRTRPAPADRAGLLSRGDASTIADPSLFTLAQWLEADGVAPARLPRVIAHRERMLSRPSVRKAIAEATAR